jgi:putative FmdB family regulatory protein
MPPFYKYACPRCGAEVEEMRPMDDANRDRPICENGDVPMVMDLVIAPVPGIVRNPAAGPRRQK